MSRIAWGLGGMAFASAAVLIGRDDPGLVAQVGLAVALLGLAYLGLVRLVGGWEE